jgi:outer membrane protein assembly factor BamE (lipoprotein component of BamABCDE complex)
MAMKRLVLLGILVFTGLIGLAGCATRAGDKKPAEPVHPQPTQDSRPLAQRLAIGMTQDQVRTGLGEPNDISIDSDHLEAWTYSSHAKSLVPYYSFSAGEFYHLVVCFDKNRKVRSWLSN